MFTTIGLFAFNLQSVCSLANGKSFKNVEVQLEDSKIWDSSRRGKADGSVFTSTTNQLRTLYVVIIKGDVGKTFRCSASHGKQPTPVPEREVANNGAPPASDQTALERDFSPFNDE